MLKRDQTCYSLTFYALGICFATSYSIPKNLSNRRSPHLRRARMHSVSHRRLAFSTVPLLPVRLVVMAVEEGPAETWQALPATAGLRPTWPWWPTSRSPVVERRKRRKWRWRDWERRKRRKQRWRGWNRRRGGGSAGSGGSGGPDAAPDVRPVDAPGTCSADKECPSQTPLCLGNRCAKCATDADCVGRSGPACAGSGLCVGCQELVLYRLRCYLRHNDQPVCWMREAE